MKNETSFTKIALGVACGILLAPLLLLAACVAAGLGLTALSVVGSATSPDGKDDVTVQVRDVVIDQVPSRPYIQLSGQVHNVGTTPDRTIMIEVDWLDEDGETVDRSRHLVVRSAEPLGSGESRAFAITSPRDKRIRSARVSIVAESVKPQAC